MVEDGGVEAGNIALVEYLNQLVHPQVGAILQGDQQGLLEQLREIIDFFGEQDGNGHLEE